MADIGEDLYETRTNIFSCDNIVDYLWRRCGKNSYPFKPDNASDIVIKTLDEEYIFGKEIMKRYDVSSEDLHNADLKRGTEYNIDTCDFQTFNIGKIPITNGSLALVYKPDRRYYSLFLLENKDAEKPHLKLLMKVKQKVGLFGSFETEMVSFY